MTKEEDGNFALILATWLGDKKVVELLLRHGAQTDAPGMTPSPLAVAALNFHLGVVDTLLYHGADTNVEVPFDDNRSCHPLEWAAITLNMGLLMVLVKHQALEKYRGGENKLCPLAIAVKHGSLYMVEFLLKYGCRLGNLSEIIRDRRFRLSSEMRQLLGYYNLR